MHERIDTCASESDLRLQILSLFLSKDASQIEKGQQRTIFSIDMIDISGHDR
jgi:hypothetical protein